MTPAQLDSLERVHRRLHSSKGGRASAPAQREPGTLADMAMFASMRRA